MGAFHFYEWLLGLTRGWAEPGPFALPRIFPLTSVAIGTWNGITPLSPESRLDWYFSQASLEGVLDVQIPVNYHLSEMSSRHQIDKNESLCFLLETFGNWKRICSVKRGQSACVKCYCIASRSVLIQNFRWDNMFFLPCHSQVIRIWNEKECHLNRAPL